MMLNKYRMFDAAGGPMQLLSFEADAAGVTLLAFRRDVWAAARAAAGSAWKEGMTMVPEGERDSAEVADMLSFLRGVGYYFMLQAPGLLIDPTPEYSAIADYLRSL